MENSNIIYRKLEDFIRKFYTNELLRGSIFFVGIGLLYFLFTLFVEYFLWLKPTARTILFYTFIFVELFLLFRFIFFPMFKLFKLQKGIGYNDASAIIGNHFSEVGDKLTNFLQLSEDKNKSELLLASIEQKANTLQPIPFGNAVSFAGNRKYLPLAIIPILFFAFFYLSGNSNMISQSLNRVVNFKQQFLPPAPFEFEVINDNLQTEQNKDFLLKVRTVGKVVPENAMIFIGNESYFMESRKQGEFEFVIPKPSEDLEFHLEANEVSSHDYELKVVTVPSIANFEMVLNFPNYLNKKSEVIKGTGNAIIPEGTQVTWKMNTLATQKVDWVNDNARYTFAKNENMFTLSKSILQNVDYQILTSNDKVQNYEKLNYQISVIKDQFPTINVSNAPDSLKVNKNFVLGQISDDYGLSKLQIVYYPKDTPNIAKKAAIAVRKDVYDQFVFSFPSNLPVEEGVSYEYYFEVFDNDAIHNYKSSKSSVFSNRIATEDEKQDEQMKQQNENINSLAKSLKAQDKQLSEMDKLQKMGKEKDNLEYKEQQKVNDFIQRQKKQDEMMKEFSEKMKENLEQFKSEKKDEKKDEKKEALQERLEKSKEEIEKNKKLLDELQKLNEKISKDELFEKMEKFQQQSKNQTKSLEQLVELTKRYYVEKKAQQIAEKMNKLAEKQDKLADKTDENNVEKQDEINKEFDKLQEELKDLQKDNKELKSPMDLPKTEEKEKSIDEDLKDAKDQLQKQQKEKAKPKQKSASKKMKQMSAQMQEQMASGEMEQMNEDIAMLRQILDNLLAYSFSQEDVMKQFKNLKRGAPSFNKNLKIQQDLKQQFKHVDDSLFAMSLRNPKIADDVTKEIGNVQYNVDRAIENLAEANVPKGNSHQQYAVSASNKLADMLSDILNGMQMQMSGSGAGKPKPGQGQGGMQLPDIIKKQEGLGEKMKKGMKKGDKPGDGEEGNQGEKEGKGQEGGQGSNGKSGGKGENGSGKGNNGKGQGNERGGENGQDGEGDAKAIMDIYKEQQQLREALEKELKKQGVGGNGQSTLDQMKQIEKQLLNKGFNNETLQKILNVKYELLKLEKAIQQQGEDKKRQSETNKKEFSNQANALPARLQDYLNSIEILNRQSLPLRSNFNQKVQEYFKTND